MGFDRLLSLNIFKSRSRSLFLVPDSRRNKAIAPDIPRWLSVIVRKFPIVSKICVRLYPHFTKDYFGPDSTRSIFLVDRPHICETIGSLRTITGNHLGRSGKVWRNRLSPTCTRVGYWKSDRLLFLNMFKNSSRSKSVGRWSSWSAEGLLKIAMSRLPSGAFVYPLELSSTLGSFRIPSAALCRGSCEGCHKESIVTKYNSKIWFYIYPKSLWILIDLRINTNTSEI